MLLYREAYAVQTGKEFQSFPLVEANDVTLVALNGKVNFASKFETLFSLNESSLVFG